MKSVTIATLTAWIVDRPELAALHDQLMEDIDARLSAGEVNQLAYGQQTLTDLHLSVDSCWKAFFRVAREVFESIVELSLAAGTLGEAKVSLRAWASRLDVANSRDNCVHVHFPAQLSAVYHLGPESIGTDFISTIPQGIEFSPTVTRIEARTGRFILFPSWLPHSPAPVDGSCGQGLQSRRRTVIAMDAHIVPAR